MKSFCILLSVLFSFVSTVSIATTSNKSANLLDECNGQNTLNLLDEESLSIEALERISASPMRNYYYNLRDNFGYNEIGSCGYVALGMLLTYYDSYYDDNIVADQYDANAHLENLNEFASSSSPGSNEESLNLNCNDESYINTIINEYSETSLHAKLIKISNELGYTKINNTYTLGTTPEKLNDVLNEYLEQNNLITTDRWSVHKYSNDNYSSLVPGKDYTYSEQMLENIKSYIELDIPVLVSIRGANGGHVVIAYDYDEEEDIVYANFGWHSLAVHSNIFNYGYEYVRGYITLNPFDLHSHSYNYEVGNIFKCSCSLPNHVHNYSYSSLSSTKHKKICYCGYFTEEAHIFNKRGTGQFSRYLICGNCGYMKLNDGTHIPIIPVNHSI